MWRTVAAVLFVVAAPAGMVPLLMREDTRLWPLMAVGTVAGALADGVRWGWRGVWIGAICGCVLALLAPFLYIPFWLYFSLPPYLEYDL